MDEAGWERPPMIKITKLTENQAKETIERGELPLDVITSQENVAGVFTQSWCPWWKRMEAWLETLVKDDIGDFSLFIYTFIYDLVPFFKDFLTFKENTWGNDTVPYVRYYGNGALIEESNYVSKESFLDRFRD